jgi:DNA-binding NtrC family response regulator
MIATSVLLIDDDENYVNQMRVILEYEGYHVDYANNGKEGLAKFEPRKYRAIITDYLMPALRGDEVAAHIREIDSKAKLILLTGYKHAIPYEKLDLFSSILEKPVSPMKILAILKDAKEVTPMQVQMG